MHPITGTNITIDSIRNPLKNLNMDVIGIRLFSEKMSYKMQKLSVSNIEVNK